MSNTHVAVLDETVQQTNLWLKRLEEEHHFQTRHAAYVALRAVLHTLRDRLTPQQSAHFAAQLPILVRGVYFEGWQAVEDKPDRKVADFVGKVAADLPPGFSRDALGTTRAVFDLLWKELDPGETAKLANSLPLALRHLWPDIAHS